jgi:glycosyltransferase involved in cell wall biosynthesis
MSSTEPTVSVLVTVYNREPYLKATLESILASSFTDFEVIVVDDCSKDRSLDIAREFADRDPRVIVHANQQNLGDYRNRNRAASLARGPYLKYVDADDLLYRHSLATMVDAMSAFPDAGLALSSNVIDPDEPYPHAIPPAEFFRLHFHGRSPIGVGPSAAIIRRSCFEAVGGFSGRQFVGDTELWLKLAERWPIVTLPPALVWWRRHPGQQMQLEHKRPEVLNVRFQLELDALRTSHLSAEERAAAEARVRQHHARRLWSLAARRLSPRVAWRLFRQSGLTFTDLLSGLRRYA